MRQEKPENLEKLRSSNLLMKTALEGGSGMEEGDYPLDFEGFAGENEGKKGCVGLAGKGLYSARCTVF
nr:hypothetical protein [Tanacetum cinerariifolium]